MLEELKQYAPGHWRVYVLFDRWYASAKLIKYIRCQGWQVLCAIKSNRKLNGTKLSQWPQRLRNQRYTPVRCSAANGKQTLYLTRRITGYLQGLRDPVAIVISHRHNRDKRPKDFLSTDLSLSSEKILTWYGSRWPVEVENWYLKQALGLGDFRVHPLEAIQKWYAVVFLVLSFLEEYRYELRDQGLILRSVSEVIQVHREMHEHQALTAACREALHRGSVEKAVECFLAKEIPVLALVS
jgi:transposase